MKPRVMLTRPKRDYSDGLGAAKSKPSESTKKPGGMGRVNYPSIEGVIIDPPPAPSDEEGKKKPGLEDVLALALALPLTDQKTLLARLSLSQQAQKPADRELEMWAVGVQTALVAVTGGEVGAAHGIVVVKRSLAPSSCWTPVADFMRAARFDAIEVSKRQSVYIMLGDLLVRYAAAVARKVQAPLTPKFVANNAQHIAAVFDNAFPGYLAAGLTPLVVSRLTEQRAS